MFLAKTFSPLPFGTRAAGGYQYLLSGISRATGSLIYGYGALEFLSCSFTGSLRRSQRG